MPSRRRSRQARRTALQVGADLKADDVARYLGKTLKDARLQGRRNQVTVADLSALAAGTVSEAEHGRGASYTLRTWSRLAAAAGATLHAYLEGATAADQPRDIVHLGTQELIVRTASAGGWKPRIEEPLDDPARGSRAADVLLERVAPGSRTADELALLEIWDWFEDVGAGFRSWDRKVARVEQGTVTRMAPDTATEPVLPEVSGCWVVRATRRNRQLLAAHRGLFAARFPGSGYAWLRALRDPTVAMPTAPALLWVSVRGDKLWPARH